MSSSENSHANVLLQDWRKYEFGLPPFADAKSSDFEDALTTSMKMHIDEVGGIAQNSEEPTFENTIAAYDRSGAVYTQVSNMFDNLCSSNGVPELQAVELKMAGPVAAHYNQLSTMPGLFERIAKVHAKRHDLDLSPEQVRLVERFHLDFVRAGTANRCVRVAVVRFTGRAVEQTNKRSEFPYALSCAALSCLLSCCETVD
jgi:peptidyl-dipeptidase Dcp